MIDIKLFEKIRDKYGDVASWAVWADEGETPKSNMDDMNLFDLKKNSNLLNILKTNVIMVGLNFSRTVDDPEPFKNFHDTSPYANDFKMRYAFKDTDFYGAYMTDIIKNFAMVDSSDVKKHLKNNPDFVRENILSFKKELRDIESDRPVIIAFGSDTYNLLKENLGDDEYSNLIQVTHYSHQINKENYKKKVHEQLNLI